MTATTTIRLKDEVVATIRTNQRIRNRLQFELDKSYPTVQRWFTENSDQLTTAHALMIISEELGIDQKDLLNTVN